MRYGGKQNQGYHDRDRQRYHQTTDGLKGCQLRNQEYAESAQGCRKALKTGSKQHRAACAEAEAPHKGS